MAADKRRMSVPNENSGYTEMKLIRDRFDLAGARAMGWEGVEVGDVIVKTVTFKIMKGEDALKMVPGLEIEGKCEAVIDNKGELG